MEKDNFIVEPKKKEKISKEDDELVSNTIPLDILELFGLDKNITIGELKKKAEAFPPPTENEALEALRKISKVIGIYLLEDEL